ncbi:aspartate aminotransferase family protein (plasmid) [Mesorhizobium sp. 131-3-5]|uniref:aspartate aminotransferase family protein n=1 Tax=Mesorhizobium sp. 131-3-5 TaxID=2744520 RepID=UPI0018EDA5F7|nr:aspartate aminotransferase family protein [Mesorhizobium sp. 131-3-5]BCH12349.1 aspartate aminotransferase family protein [Mesorhizobium sp. 131-3-5]
MDLGHNEVGATSAGLFTRAKRVFGDGTTRATIERDPIPRYMERGEGAYLIDVDGRRFLDLNGNFTTLIHGHGFEPVAEAVSRQIRSGSCFANPTAHELDLAELITTRVPGIDWIRFVNTGTEAVLFAVKAARAYTGRPAIAKIEGAYHGAYDWVEVSQASGPSTWGDPAEPASVPYYRGMPETVLNDVVTLRFNDVEGSVRLLEKHAHRLAAIIIDPTPSRAGLIVPEPEFVETINAMARKLGIVLIADEVLNFRQSYEGASARHGFRPDLFTLGKVIGGGLPIGAIGGSQEIMSVFGTGEKRAPLPAGGTFSANPLSMVAGLAAMSALDHAAFEHLERLGDRLRDRLSDEIAKKGAPFTVTGVASLFRIHAKRKAPRDFREALPSPAEAVIGEALTRAYAAAGVVFPNGAAACLSTPMTNADVDLVVDVFSEFLGTHSHLFESVSHEHS